MSAATATAPAGAFYFSGWEGRRPPAPLPVSAARDLAFQALAVLAAALGAHYVAWRWASSLNPEHLLFSGAIALAETLAYLGAMLFFLSLWRTADPQARPPPRTLGDVVAEPPATDRPLRVDVLIATRDEPAELVRLSVRDALAVTYPHPLACRVHVLDDGRRDEVRRMASEEGVGYLARATNAGFKAGNLTNAVLQTDGDFIVICDADTRPFPELLEETLGYFRDPRVAWVQTPQWFYDVDPGTRLPDWLARVARLGRAGRLAGRAVEAALGPVTVGADPLAQDPLAFYDLVQRSRNWCNASFCCGAGSVHRREAIMETALRGFGAGVAAALPRPARRRGPALARDRAFSLAQRAARGLELTPYRFHVSEDIYTSIALHADAPRRWRSVYHPRVVTRMLSPQDLVAWTVQRFKYACGTLDIAWRDNPLRLSGLTAWQKVMYAATICGYLAPLWTVPLLLAPLAFFFAGYSPVRAYDVTFFARVVPFLVASRLAFMVRAWRIPTWRNEQFHLASCWLHLRALWHVLANRPIRFHVTPKLAARRGALRLAAPHLALLGATAAGIAYRGADVASGATPAIASAFVANVFWSLHNALCFAPFISAARAAGPRAAPAAETVA